MASGHAWQRAFLRPFAVQIGAMRACHNVATQHHSETMHPICARLITGSECHLRSRAEEAMVRVPDGRSLEERLAAAVPELLPELGGVGAPLPPGAPAALLVAPGAMCAQELKRQLMGLAQARHRADMDMNCNIGFVIGCPLRSTLSSILQSSLYLRWLSAKRHDFDSTGSMQACYRVLGHHVWLGKIHIS